jgi:hypothetical protein
VKVPDRFVALISTPRRRGDEWPESMSQHYHDLYTSIFPDPPIHRHKSATLAFLSALARDVSELRVL